LLAQRTGIFHLQLFCSTQQFSRGLLFQIEQLDLFKFIKIGHHMGPGNWEHVCYSGAARTTDKMGEDRHALAATATGKIFI
jgi:hypothetical protein